MSGSHVLLPLRPNSYPLRVILKARTLVRAALKRLFALVDPILFAQPQIYTRGTAVNDLVAFVFAITGAFVLLTILLAPVIQGPTAPVEAYAVGFLFFVIGVVGAHPMGSKLRPRVRPKRDHFRNSEKWTILVVLLLLLLLRARLTWSASADSWEILKWVLASIGLCLLSALGMSLLVRITFRIFVQAYRQLRAWNRPAFANWTDEHHQEATHNPGIFSKKAPDPNKTDPPMSIDAARSYATWCTERANDVSLASQLLVLLGGAIAGTGIPVLIFDQSKFMYALLIALSGVMIGLIGLQWSQTAVPRWHQRSSIYKQYSEKTDDEPVLHALPATGTR